jgi:predicted amidohydrolase YtcJ
MISDDLLRADLTLINGKVVTVDADNSIMEAVAVKGGRIVAVGSTAEVSGLMGKGTALLDLAGKTVLPGIIDSHTHPGHGATRLLEIDCRAPHIKGIRDL